MARSRGRPGPSLALLIPLVSACSAFRAPPLPPVSPEAAIGVADQAARQAGAQAGTQVGPDDLADVFAPGRVAECLTVRLGAQDDCRDRIAQALLVAIDLRYQEFEIDFFNETRLGGFGATLASLGLSTAAALSGVPPSTARLLSALSAGVTGTREAFSREVLADRAAAALQAAMRAERNAIAVRIRDGLGRPAVQYPLGVALSDLTAYYRAGTLAGAVVGVTQAVVERAAEQQRRLDAVQGVGVSSRPAATALQRFIDTAPTLQERVRRERLIESTAAQVGAGRVLALSFVMDTAIRVERHQIAVARRLGLVE